jgi:vitamin B12 transporter
LATHLFYRKSHDAVGYDNATWKYGNIEKEKAKGFDIQFKKAFEKGFSMSLGYTYTNTKQTTDGNVNHNVSGFVPKHAINLGLSYNSKKFDVDLMARACLDRNSTIPGFFPSKNYVVTDLAVNYKPIKELKAYIKVNNLFDKFYTECSAVESYDPVGTAGRWYTMPGRSIVAGVEYSF